MLMRLQRKGTQKTQNISVEGKERRKRDLEEEAHPSWHAPFSPRAFLTLCSLCLWDVGGFPRPSFHWVHCLTSPSAYSVAFLQKPFLTKPGWCWASSPRSRCPTHLFSFPRSTYHHLTYNILILAYVLFVSATRMSALQMQDFGVFFFTAEFPAPTQCIAHSLSSSVNIWGMNE